MRKMCKNQFSIHPQKVDAKILSIMVKIQIICTVIVKTYLHSYCNAITLFSSEDGFNNIHKMAPSPNCPTRASQHGTDIFIL